MQKDVFELSFYKITIEYWKKGYRSVTVLSFSTNTKQKCLGGGSGAEGFCRGHEIL